MDNNIDPSERANDGPPPKRAEEWHLWVSATAGIIIALGVFGILWLIDDPEATVSALDSVAEATLAFGALLLFVAASLQAMSHQRADDVSRQNAELVGKFVAVSGTVVVMVGSGIATGIVLSQVAIGLATIALVVFGAWLLGLKLRAATKRVLGEAPSATSRKR